MRTTRGAGHSVVGIVIVAAWLFGAGTAAAQRSVEAIANDTSPDRQKMLEDGARREKTILLYTTGTQIKPIIDRFEQKYPYIKVELARSSSADTARKVVEEYRAGFENVDMFELGSHGLIVPRDENILQPFQSPEMAAYKTDSIEPKRHWAIVRESYTGIGYNNKLLSADKAPKSYQELLEPQWQNRLSMSSMSTTAVNWVGALAIVHGADFVRKL